eukprot:4311778-Pleurochrysis_carterae.AAC.1
MEGKAMAAGLVALTAPAVSVLEKRTCVPAGCVPVQDRCIGLTAGTARAAGGKFLGRRGSR